MENPEQADSKTGPANTANPSDTSESIFCRICHSGSSVSQQLISPCSCKGSLGFVHKKCIQTWVDTSLTSHCEICRTEFKTTCSSRSLLEWLRNPATGSDLRAAAFDFCWLLLCLTLLCLAGYLCTLGATHFVSPTLRVGLLLLKVLLYIVAANIGLIFCGGIVQTARRHYEGWSLWRRTNYRREIVGIDRSTEIAVDGRPNVSMENDTTAETVDCPESNSSDTARLIADLPGVHCTFVNQGFLQRGSSSSYLQHSTGQSRSKSDSSIASQRRRSPAPGVRHQSNFQRRSSITEHQI